MKFDTLIAAVRTLGAMQDSALTMALMYRIAPGDDVTVAQIFETCSAARAKGPHPHTAAERRATGYMLAALERLAPALEEYLDAVRDDSMAQVLAEPN